jgi:hypothetical protein
MVQFVKPNDVAVGANPQIRVNINLIVSGSKRLSGQEKAALNIPAGVHIRITDAEDEDRVLYDEVAPAKLFKADAQGRQSCGYGVSDVAVFSD